MLNTTSLTPMPLPLSQAGLSPLATSIPLSGAPMNASLTSLSTTNLAAPVGATPNLPYQLDNQSYVNFPAGQVPQYVGYQGGTYQLNQSIDNTSIYNHMADAQKTLTLSYNGQTKPGGVIGYEQQQVQVGTQQVYVGDELVGYDTQSQNIKFDINRELDGVGNRGAVGEILNEGTTQLLDPAKAQSFFSDPKLDQYKVSSLTGEDNQVAPQQIDLFKNQAADEMYVAGDPVVGGKGNNFQPVEVTPETGFLTMFEDGTDAGRKVTINAKVDQINTEGNVAFTQYGFVVQDDNAQKYVGELKNGQFFLDGQEMLPGDVAIIGDPNSPVAQFYHDMRPGGENGTQEPRLVFQYFDKPTAQTRQQLLDAGMNDAEIDALGLAPFEANFAFRIPDGQGSYRAPLGAQGGLESSNNVKTYYDAHFKEPPSFSFEKTVEYQTPRYEPRYVEQPIYDYVQNPIYGTDYGVDVTPYEPPVYEPPVYEPPIYEPPVYEPPATDTDPPVYEPPVYTPPVYEPPVYETPEPPVYTPPAQDNEPPTYTPPVYTPPVYEQPPAQDNEPPVYTPPVYEPPVYEEPATDAEPPVYTPPVYEQPPVYTPPVYTPPVYEQPPAKDTEPPVYTPPVYTPPVYEQPPAKDNEPPVYTPPTYTPPAKDTNPPAYKPPVYTPPVYNPPPAKDKEPPAYKPPINYDADGPGYAKPVYPPPSSTPPAKDTNPPATSYPTTPATPPATDKNPAPVYSTYPPVNSTPPAADNNPFIGQPPAAAPATPVQNAADAQSTTQSPIYQQPPVYQNNFSGGMMGMMQQMMQMVMQMFMQIFQMLLGQFRNA